MAEPALVTDLFCDSGTLAGRLSDALRDGQWVDAYLFAAGLSQLADDRLHPDPLLFNRAACFLRGLPSRPARLAGTAAAGLAAATRADHTAAGRRLVKARRPLAELTVRLAGQVLAGQDTRGHPAGDVAALLGDSLRAVPLAAGELLRMPSCFHSFDQHPDDVLWLADAFRDRYAEPDRLLCVLGVRTSGSYLAPLHAAALRAAGWSRVELLTYRPGRPFLGGERRTLTAITRAGGLVLVVDDPPASGTSLAAAARALARAGVAPSSIVLLLSSFGTRDDLPEVLRPWAAVIQPWADWSVHRRLEARRVRDALTRLIGPGTEVRDLRPAHPPYMAGERGHLRARFTARLYDRRTATEISREIVAEGAGLGYIGRHGLAVARALPGQVPQVYGFADGLLYRDWLPPVPAPAPPGTRRDLAGTVAAYVDERRRALPAPSASADRLAGRDPAWEAAAKVLSAQYEGLSVLLRPLLLDRLVRRLLVPAHPAVLDSKTDLRHWLPDPAAAGKPRKVDFYQRAYGHLDLACYDPVFDLAGAAADPPGPGFGELLRRAYQRASGERVDGERWLLYRLAQLRRLGVAGDLPRGDVLRRSTAAVHDYLAALYLRDLPSAVPGTSSGPLCAIDLDGVLECDRLGFSATSPTGMLVLRALIAHGYRPVLATGRSVPEVRDRCTAFGLAGAVAEYGAAVYSGGEVGDLRPLGADALLGQIRKELSALPDVEVDPDYRYAVRARFRCGPLSAVLTGRIPALSDPSVRVVHGEGQTDITAAGIDKGTGLAALMARLAGADCAFAMGDAPPDLPMLASARMARAPRNALFADGGAAIRRTRRAYQAGLAEACADLLGHRPGRCPACRPPVFTSRTRTVLAILDLHANGVATVPARTALLAALAVTRF